MKVQDLTDDLDYKLEPIIYLKNGRPVPVCYEMLLRSKKLQVFPRKVLLQALADVGMGQNNQEMVSYNSDFLVAIKFSLLQYSTQQLAERVKTIVQWKSLAQQKGVILVVEGVETPQEANLLAAYGCLQQGYLWNKWLCLQ